MTDLFTTEDTENTEDWGCADTGEIAIEYCLLQTPVSQHHENLCALCVLCG